MGNGVPTRTLLLWCPDWPVVAAAREHGHPVTAPMAVIEKGVVYACSAAAREAGVRRGLRLREAQSRCPELVVTAYDPAVDARAFEPVVAVVEDLAPGVEIVRPGRCALRVRGPARYFGGEAEAAVRFRERLAAEGVDCRVGIADGPFAAEQAARQAAEEDVGAVIFPVGESAHYLAPLPVSVLDRPALIGLLRRLGIRTLGEFANLPARQVFTRFGTDGARAHRLAAGHDDRMLAFRTPPPELVVRLDLEPPLDLVDTIAASLRGPADRFVRQLAERGLVCTCLRIEVTGERGDVTHRSWRHPRWYDADDVLDRVRWQLRGDTTSGSAGTPGATGLTSGVTRIELHPEELDREGAHPDGLWGEQTPDEGVHRTLSRVQSMLGHREVLIACPTGGRGPADRMTLVPWGERLEPPRPADRPWPGHVPSPAPSSVLHRPHPAVVLDVDGEPVGIDERAVLSGVPAWFGLTDAEGRSLRAPEPILTWAGPWPVDERWWDPAAARRRTRFQIVVVDGRAWLVCLEGGRWWVEASYD